MEEKKLTYDLICAAVHGNRQAQEQILNYYDEYINALASVEDEKENGEKIRYVDEDIYIMKRQSGKTMKQSFCPVRFLPFLEIIFCFCG